MTVTFFFADIKATIPNRTNLKEFISTIFKKERKKANSLNYIFCSDAYLLNINRQFLNHDFYTDIITFDLSNSSEIEGEIYISIDRVKDNAKQHGNTFKEEFHRVIFHGVLHLCGYKDKSAKEEKLMREMEDKYLKLYFN